MGGMSRMVSSSDILAKNPSRTKRIEMKEIFKTRNKEDYLGRRTKIICTMGKQTERKKKNTLIFIFFYNCFYF